MNESPVSQQYDHFSIRQAIDSSYLDSIEAAVALQRFVNLKRGNPFNLVADFLTSFVALFRLTKSIQEMRDQQICKDIDVWLVGYNQKSVSISEISKMLLLYDRYIQELHIRGILAVTT